MSEVDQLFKGMATAQMFGRGNYMNEGLFLVETSRIFLKKGFKGNSFICEFKILESSNPKHAPGSTGSWVVKMDNPNAFSDIKSLVFAIIGKDPKKVPPAEDGPEALKEHTDATDLVKAACDEEYAKTKKMEPGLLEGVQLRLETNVVTTKKGTPFTRHNWAPAA